MLRAYTVNCKLIRPTKGGTVIYRLATGARSNIAKHFMTGMMVLAITIGFPVAAAWLNHENLTVHPRPIAQTDKQGAVLGDSTDKQTSNDNGGASMHVSATPKPTALSVKPWKQPTKAATTATTTTVPVPATPVTNAPSQQTAATATVTTPTDTTPTTSDPNAGLEVTVLNTDVNIGVSPSGLDAHIGL
jgi:hypothetical protein